MVVGSLLTKLPSSSGFIIAGNRGSVAATNTMVRIDRPNMRQYGAT